MPTNDDFPYDGSKEEIDRYLKKKMTELWHFKKGSSSGSAEYGASKNARVKEYQKKKKLEKKSSGSESERRS